MSPCRRLRCCDHQDRGRTPRNTASHMADRPARHYQSRPQPGQQHEIARPLRGSPRRMRCGTERSGLPSARTRSAHCLHHRRPYRSQALDSGPTRPSIQRRTTPLHRTCASRQDHSQAALRDRSALTKLTRSGVVTARVGRRSLPGRVCSRLTAASASPSVATVLDIVARRRRAPPHPWTPSPAPPGARREVSACRVRAEWWTTRPYRVRLRRLRRSARVLGVGFAVRPATRTPDATEGDQRGHARPLAVTPPRSIPQPCRDRKEGSTVRFLDRAPP